MKGLYGSKIGTIFRLLILVLFLILCFFIKRNVELMLPEAVEYAVLDNSNAISFSEADEAACADGDLTVNVLSRTTGAASTSNNTGLSEKVNIVYTDDKFPTVHNSLSNETTLVEGDTTIIHRYRNIRRLDLLGTQHQVDIRKEELSLG